MASVTSRRGVLGLQGRVLLGLTVILAASLAGLGWFVLTNQWRLLMDDVQRRGQQQAQVTAQSSVDHIRRGNLYLLETLMATAEYSPEVAFCRIVDPEGNDFVPSTRQIPPERATLLVVRQDIVERGEVLGQVWIGMKTEAARQEIQSTAVRLIAAFGAVLAGVLLFGHFFLRYSVVTPIQSLVRMARNVGDRQFVRSDMDGRRDEIGQLAGELNVMSASLKTAYHELEQAVAERTQELHAALGELEAIFHNSLVGIVVLEADGRVVRMNARAREMFGVREETTSLKDLVGGVTGQAELLLRYHQAVAEGDIFHVDYPMPRQDGSRFWVHVLAKPVSGLPERSVWVFEDITERKRVHETLRIQARELHSAKERAEAAARARTEFLARMSHEIRTPMNAILAMAQLLAETPLNEEQQEYVHTFSSAGEILLSIINDILDFAKIEEGHVSIEHIPFAVTNVVEDVSRLFQGQAQHKGLLMNMRIAPDVGPYVEGDPIRLRQILMNLVGNALKFTHHGSVCVEVDTVDRSGVSLCRFQVRDTGIGIPADKLDSIFESFSQADTSTSRKYGGTGLGLAIAKRLVTLMGGAITVQSVVGQGSEFTVLLPLPEATAPAAEEQRLKASACALPQRQATLPVDDAPEDPLRILVVDDVDANRRVVELFLRQVPNIAVTYAVNGIEAIHAVQSSTFDVVFMDIEMPEMDGLSAVRAIRDWEQKTDAPASTIVAMTAHAWSEQREEIEASGCDGYLPKPIQRAALVDMVEQWRCVRRRSLGSDRDLGSGGASTCRAIVNRNMHLAMRHFRLEGEEPVSC